MMRTECTPCETTHYDGPGSVAAAFHDGVLSCIGPLQDNKEYSWANGQESAPTEPSPTSCADGCLVCRSKHTTLLVFIAVVYVAGYLQGAWGEIVVDGMLGMIAKN